MPPARGRPPKLTPEIRKRIVDAVRAGNYLETAAKFAGVAKQTLYNWMARGRRASRGEYREFVDAVEKALSDAEVADVAIIGKAAREGNWQAAAWRLERKFPDRWGRRTKVEAEVGGEVVVAARGGGVAILPPEDPDG